MKYATIVIYLAAVLIYCQNIFAQWNSDPLINTPVCVWDSNQQRAEIISDNKGGAIIAWFDFRMGNADIFIQRLDSDGNQKWGNGGKAVCINTSNEVYHKITEDGKGGCIIVWEDDRNGNSDIYAQRVDSSGNILWDSSGVAICNLPLDQEDPQIVSDESGGAIIIWEVKQGTVVGENGLFAQRIDSNGQILWIQNGVSILTSPLSYSIHWRPKIAGDENNGAVICWINTTNTIIHAQRLNSAGFRVWLQEGVPVCLQSYDNRLHSFINVKNGKFVLCWTSVTSPGEYRGELRTQSIDTVGIINWGTNGVVVCSSEVSINPAFLSYDNQNAVIIGWEDHRSPGMGATIYCQKLSLDGTPQWQQNGRPVSSLNGMQGQIKLVCDQNGNSIACWLDARTNPEWDIYAQKFNALGNILWEVQGRQVSTTTGHKFYQNIILTNKEDYITAWEDERGTDFDIYAQSLNSLITSVDNSSVQFPKLITLSQNYPNPFNPSTNISWKSRVGSWQTLKIYDVLGNEVATLVDEYKPDGTYKVEWDVGNYPSGVYFYQLKAGSLVETKKMILIK